MESPDCFTEWTWQDGLRGSLALLRSNSERMWHQGCVEIDLVCWLLGACGAHCTEVGWRRGTSPRPPLALVPLALRLQWRQPSWWSCPHPPQYVEVSVPEIPSADSEEANSIQASSYMESFPCRTQSNAGWKASQGMCRCLEVRLGCLRELQVSFLSGGDTRGTGFKPEVELRSAACLLRVVGATREFGAESQQASSGCGVNRLWRGGGDGGGRPGNQRSPPKEEQAKVISSEPAVAREAGIITCGWLRLKGTQERGKADWP